MIFDSKKDSITFNNGEILFYSEYSDKGYIKTVIKGQSIRTNDQSLEEKKLRNAHKPPEKNSQSQLTSKL